MQSIRKSPFDFFRFGSSSLVVVFRGVMSSLEMSSMTAAVSSEVTVYGAVGAVFLFLLVALLLGLSFSSPCKAGDGSKYLSSNNLGYDRDQVDLIPSIIFPS